MRLAPPTHAPPNAVFRRGRAIFDINLRTSRRRRRILMRRRKCTQYCMFYQGFTVRVRRLLWFSSALSGMTLIACSCTSSGPWSFCNRQGVAPSCVPQCGGRRWRLIRRSRRRAAARRRRRVHRLPRPHSVPRPSLCGGAPSSWENKALESERATAQGMFDGAP